MPNKILRTVQNQDWDFSASPLGLSVLGIFVVPVALVLVFMVAVLRFLVVVEGVSLPGVVVGPLGRAVCKDGRQLLVGY